MKVRAPMQHRLRTRARRLANLMLGGERRALAGIRTDDRELVREIRARKLTYLSDSRLECLIKTVREIVAHGTPGQFLEAGCALGGSTILISRLKEPRRPLRVYDVFATIPPPTDMDGSDATQRYETIREGKSRGIGDDRYYGYEPDLYERVLSNLMAFGIDYQAHQVELIKGLLQDTLTIHTPVAFAHIDVDWYEPVKTSLERITPHLNVGGVLIVDDYNDWGGCRRATDEYFSQRHGDFEFDEQAGSLKIIRRK